MAQTVIGFFNNPTEAQRAVEQLQQLGVSRDSIDVSSGGTGTSGAGTNVSNNDRGSENGITRFFKSIFGDDDDDAERYSKVAQNSTIVTVHAQNEDQAERAADILDECGAVDVDEKATQYGYASSGRSRGDNEDVTVNRVQENLEVGKRQVERGGVRVRSRIVERPVEESVRLREEHVHVERNPVNRPLNESDRAAMQDRDIELTEQAEVPVINKEARVVEEIRVSKDVTEREETVRDTVRNTEVDIDKDIDTNRTSNDPANNRNL